LRQLLAETAKELGCGLGDLTVLATQNDPFRVDTPARHRDGAWLAQQVEELGIVARVHLRGLHYVVIGRIKPDGLPYTNTESDWLWLSENAAKSARWNGYIDFERIVDQRNAAPVIRQFKKLHTRPFISVGFEVKVPSADDLIPSVWVADFEGVQPFKLVFFGEKSSLDDVLAPIARDHQADLYLPTGEISDTLLHMMAMNSVEDGRPMVVFTFSDCDPAGWQMPISIARKLQAFKELYPDMPAFQVRRVGLTPDQVREYGLPSMPLKDTERRADKWTAAMGVEQTEIDALASLRSDLLRTIARDALTPFFDRTLARRVNEAKQEWLEEAQAQLDASLDDDERSRIQTEATERLAEVRAELEDIAALEIPIDGIELPESVVPTYELETEPDGLPLIDSRWSFADQTRTLKASKAYES
jgi:hypothetical protein